MGKKSYCDGLYGIFIFHRQYNVICKRIASEMLIHTANERRMCGGRGG